MPDAQIGLACPKCGGKITSSGHLCSMGSGSATPPMWTQGALSPVVIVDDETKRLLERIATALEKIAEIK